jgi:uncharacterized protein Veg
MVKVGQKVKFDPYKGLKVGSMASLSVTLTGKVIEVFEDHHWFSVQYTDEENNKRRTSFNFADIGVNVFIL